jgi:hypothetical protein
MLRGAHWEPEGVLGAAPERQAPACTAPPLATPPHTANLTCSSNQLALFAAARPSPSRDEGEPGGPRLRRPRTVGGRPDALQLPQSDTAPGSAGFPHMTNSALAAPEDLGAGDSTLLHPAALGLPALIRERVRVVSGAPSATAGVGAGGQVAGDGSGPSRGSAMGDGRCILYWMKVRAVRPAFSVLGSLWLFIVIFIALSLKMSRCPMHTQEVAVLMVVIAWPSVLSIQAGKLG